MEENNLLKKFVKTLILLVEVRSLVKDDFFRNRLNDKIFDLGNNILNFSLEGTKNNTLQSKLTAEKSFARISELIDSLKELEYFNLIKDQSLLLKAEYSLLDIKFWILKGIKTSNSLKDKKPEYSKEVSTSDITPTLRSIFRGNQDLTETKKKILNFIKSYPNTRTKDIIYELNMISGRTVKRNLIDLLKSGFVKKRVDNKAVYYYASE